MANEGEKQFIKTGLFSNLSDFNVEVVAEAIQDNKVQLHAVVEELGPQLTSTNILERRQSTQLLVDMICALPFDFLNTAQVQFLIEFFCNRLQDHHSVPHALHGILKLCQCANFPKEMTQQIIQTIFKEVHVPSQLYEDRYCVYSILFVLLQTCLKDIQAIGSDFVFNFIQVMDGEKNPRCLMIAFQIIPFITCNIDLGVFVEDLFEVISCYFPVDFTPRDNDPLGITREDLAAALQTGLASTKKFAKYCLPLLLEKLDSDLSSAWLDSWNLLIACCKVYLVESFESFLSPIWEAVRKQVFVRFSEENTSLSLSALTAVIKAISPRFSEVKDSTLEKFLTEIISECKQHFSETGDTEKLYQTSKILQAVAVASQTTCSKVLSFVFPFLIQEYSVHTQATKRKMILNLLAIFLDIEKKFKGNNEDYKNYHESAVSLFFSALSENENEIKLSGLRGLLVALNLSDVLKNRHFDLLAKHVLHLMETENGDNISSEALTLLSNFALCQPDIVKEQIVLPMLAMLSTSEFEEKTLPYKHVIQTLAAASSHMAILTEVRGPVFDILQKEFTSKGKGDSNHTSTLATWFLSVTSYHMATLCPPVSFLYSQFTLPLMRLCLERCKLNSQPFTAGELSAVEVICRVIKSVVTALDESSASDLITEVASSCLHIIFGREIEDFLPLYSSTPITISNHCLLVTLLILKSTIASLPRGVSIPKIPELFSLLLTSAINKSSDYKITEVASQCLALILLKMKTDDKLSDLVTKVSKFLATFICSAECTLQKEKALLVWVWVTKALVVQSHKLMTQFIDQMTLWLQDEKLGRLAAEGFHTVVDEIPEISTKNYPNIKLLYRQRFFVETSPKLLEGYSHASDGQKANYVMALCHQLKFIPKPVLLSELPSLIALLIQSLHQKNDDLLLSTLRTFVDLLRSDDGRKLLESHIHTLVPRLLCLLTEKWSMELRLLCLQCLEIIASMPAHLLIPHQQEVINKLGACLDDRKRLVRKNVVLARCQWYLLSQPGS